ncbi:MAG TPA: Na+/H+ antiporter NhaA [Jiangellaceae bacterium]|nr:Na+/H+ antiporter NhaA [Jiangellaceae bacterium]
MQSRRESEQPKDPIRKLQQATDDGIWHSGPFWLASERPLARYVGRPIANFLRVESAGGIVLLAAALIALVLANSPWSDTFEQFWTTEVTIEVGRFTLSEDLRHWVNDALMAVFFFVVGLEIKYELVGGELRDPRRAAVPIAAAFGGMAVPALLYAAINPGTPELHGWGIPMATDIAFALGVVAILGRRLPSSARVFMLTLAIVDDIGAITVIAIFYTESVSLGWLAVALLGIVAVVVLRRLRVWSLSVYIVIGAIVWLATFQSGVHATIAGVVMGLLAPAKPLLDQDQARQYAREHAPDRLDAVELRKYRFLLGESVPVAERLESALHPWSAYVILPIFALANAGIDLRGGVLSDALSASVTMGVAAGLVIGKSVGISLAAWLAVRFGLGRLPDGIGWDRLIGLAMVAGIGFTVSLFITGLAFDPGSQLEADAKVGVLAGSIIAAGLGSAVLAGRARPAGP